MPMRPPTALLNPIEPLSLQFPMSLLYISAGRRPEGGSEADVGLGGLKPTTKPPKKRFVASFPLLD